MVRREGTRSVLIDLASIPFGLSDEDRLQVIRSTAERLRDVRLAIVTHTPWRLAQLELAAQRMGLQSRVFGDLSQARSRLGGDLSSPSE